MSRLTADTTQIKAIAGSSLSQAPAQLHHVARRTRHDVCDEPATVLLVLLAIPLTILPLIAFWPFVRRLSRRAQDTLAELRHMRRRTLPPRAPCRRSPTRVASDRIFGATWNSPSTPPRRACGHAPCLTALAMFLVIGSITGVLWFAAAAVIDEHDGGRLSQFVLYAVFAGAAFAQISESRRE